jgi:hypothetical protein
MTLLRPTSSGQRKRPPSSRQPRRVGAHNLPASERKLLGTHGLSVEGGHGTYPAARTDVADLTSLSTPNAFSTTPTVFARNRVELSAVPS